MHDVGIQARTALNIIRNTDAPGSGVPTHMAASVETDGEGEGHANAALAVRQNTRERKMDLSDHVRILTDKISSLHRSIERRNFPAGLISDTSKHDAAQAFEEAANWVDTLIEEWTDREFDGVALRDETLELRHLQHELV